MISELERQEADRLAAVEGLSPLQISADSDSEMRAIVAKLKRKTPTRMLRQMLAADPSVRPILKNLSLGYSEES